MHLAIPAIAIAISHERIATIDPKSGAGKTTTRRALVESTSTLDLLELSSSPKCGQESERSEFRRRHTRQLFKNCEIRRIQRQNRRDTCRAVRRCKQCVKYAFPPKLIAPHPPAARSLPDHLSRLALRASAELRGDERAPRFRLRGESLCPRHASHSAFQHLAIPFVTCPNRFENRADADWVRLSQAGSLGLLLLAPCFSDDLLQLRQFLRGKLRNGFFDVGKCAHRKEIAPGWIQNFALLRSRSLLREWRVAFCSRRAGLSPLSCDLRSSKPATIGGVTLPVYVFELVRPLAGGLRIVEGSRG